MWSILRSLPSNSLIYSKCWDCFYHHLNIPLKDPTLPTFLKIQIQITGCPITHEAYVATIHTQFTYRLQTHSIDLAYPWESEYSLYITIDPNKIPLVALFQSRSLEMNCWNFYQKNGSPIIKETNQQNNLFTSQTHLLNQKNMDLLR